MYDNLSSNQARVAVITGGNKGIGLGITQLLLSRGYQVIIGARSEILNLDNSKNCFFIKGDVQNAEFHEILATEAINRFERLDLYINNAGFSEWKSIDDISEKFLLDIFSTNLFGAFWGCKSASKYLSQNGSIINISSIAGKRGSKNNSAYVATKFAMNGLTQSLAKELGEKDIRVNAICPVLVSTEGLFEALNKDGAPGNKNLEAFINKFIEDNSALGRLPDVNDVAEMVYFLASPAAKAITGQCINVDCGVLPQ